MDNLLLLNVQDIDTQVVPNYIDAKSAKDVAYTVFKKHKKSFWLLLHENWSSRTFKNRPIWSHCRLLTSRERGLRHRTLTYFVRGSITVQLTSCLIGLDLAKQVSMLLIQHKQSSWIQTSQAGGQSYSDTSPSKVSECSLLTVVSLLCDGSSKF